MFLRLKWKARDQRDADDGAISHAFTLCFLQTSAPETLIEVECDLQTYREAQPGDVWELRRVGDHS